MEKEIRSLNIEFKAIPEGRKIEGRAIPFNILSPNREGFREMIAPEAVEGVIERSDIKFLYNHDNSKGFLARNKKGKGSLCIETKEDGVYFSFDCPTDNLGEYVWQRMQKGELDEMSWAFTVAEDTWRKCDDGVYERIITRFDGLYDFSVVDNSYYGIEGAVKCARFAELQEQERQENEKKLAEIKAEEERQAKEKLDEYYKQLIEDNKHYM